MLATHRVGVENCSERRFRLARMTSLMESPAAATSSRLPPAFLAYPLQHTRAPLLSQHELNRNPDWRPGRPWYVPLWRRLVAESAADCALQTSRPRRASSSRTSRPVTPTLKTTSRRLARTRTRSTRSRRAWTRLPANSSRSPARLWATRSSRRAAFRTRVSDIHLLRAVSSELTP